MPGTLRERYLGPPQVKNMQKHPMICLSYVFPSFSFLEFRPVQAFDQEKVKSYLRVHPK